VNSLTKLWVTLSTFLVPTSRKEDKGAGIVEYAAILILVAAIAVGIWALGIPDQVRGAIDSSVDQILQGPE
jgi:Flp pilus assembly pilin Flp